MYPAVLAEPLPELVGVGALHLREFAVVGDQRQHRVFRDQTQRLDDFVGSRGVTLLRIYLYGELQLLKEQRRDLLRRKWVDVVAYKSPDLGEVGLHLRVQLLPELLEILLIRHEPDVHHAVDHRNHGDVEVVSFRQLQLLDLLLQDRVDGPGIVSVTGGVVDRGFVIDSFEARLRHRTTLFGTLDLVGLILMLLADNLPSGDGVLGGLAARHPGEIEQIRELGFQVVILPARREAIDPAVLRRILLADAQLADLQHLLVDGHVLLHRRLLDTDLTSPDAENVFDAALDRPFTIAPFPAMVPWDFVPVDHGALLQPLPHRNAAGRTRDFFVALAADATVAVGQGLETLRFQTQQERHQHRVVERAHVAAEVA